MKSAICVCFALVLLSGSVAAQKTKPWMEWSKKECEKTLNDSAWSQTQTEETSRQPTQTSAVTQVAAPRAAGRELDREGESGENKPATPTKFFVRFLSAKPVRAAFARQVLLAQKEPNPELITQLQGFVDRNFADYIVVSVGVEVGDERQGAMLSRAFTAATTDALKQTVYLERKDGKRVFLMEYRAPVGDGMGAKFVFPRALDGQPFLSEADNVRFYAQLSEKLKLNTRYRLSDMMYDGKLEY
jgi:hypothetical protein